MSVFRVSVPATSANLGPGYDTLGLALDLRLEAVARVSDTWSVAVMGEGADLLPSNEQNLILAAYLASGIQDLPKLALEVTNPIPISRGLGSSATAVVCGLALAQLVSSGSVDRDRLFQTAVQVEGHPDNVAPAVYGGLCVCSYENGRPVSKKGALSTRIRVALISPNVTSDTNMMRNLLPKTYPQDVLDQNQTFLNHLLNGLEQADPAGLKYSEADLIHQPYRFEAQPVSQNVYEALREIDDVQGAFLSGSGATVGAWILDDTPVLAKLEEIVTTLGILAQCRVVGVDHKGIVFTKST